MSNKLRITVGKGKCVRVSVIMGLGVVDLAIGILALIPLSLGARDKLLKSAFYDGFKVCLTTGFAAIVLAGILLIIT